METPPRAKVPQEDISTASMEKKYSNPQPQASGCCRRKVSKTLFKEGDTSKKPACIIAISIAAVLLLVACSVLAYFLWPQKASLFQQNPGPVYQKGMKLKYFYVMQLSEELRFKTTPKNETNASKASIKMNVTVIVDRNDVLDGGNLVLFLGLEPADPDMIDESSDGNNDSTEDQYMMYEVTLNAKHKLVSIRGVRHSLNAQNTGYLIALVQLLTPHIRRDLLAANGRNLVERGLNEEQFTNENADVSSVGVTIPSQEESTDSDGNTVYTSTETNENIAYPSAEMEGSSPPIYTSNSRAVINSDNILVSDQRHVTLTVGSEEESDEGRNLGEDEQADEESEEDIVHDALYQHTQVDGSLYLLESGTTDGHELDDIRATLQTESTTLMAADELEDNTRNPNDGENDEIPEQEEDEEYGEDSDDEGRNLLTNPQIRQRMRQHIPNNFNQLKGREGMAKRDLVNLRVLGQRVVGGVYIGGAYYYQIEPEGIGAFISGGGGIYVRSSLYTNDFSFFLTGGATVEFLGDKMIFNLGELRQGVYTQRSWGKTLPNPVPGIQNDLVEILNNEDTVINKIKQIMDRIGSSDLQVPSEFDQFGRQCSNLGSILQRLIAKNDPQLTNCVQFLIDGTDKAIAQLNKVKTNTNNEAVKKLIRTALSVSHAMKSLLKVVKSKVVQVEEVIQNAFKAISVPVNKDISHLNARKTIFKKAFPVWVLMVHVHARSYQKASTSVRVDVAKLQAGAMPSYEASIQVNAYLSAYIAKAGIKVYGTIAKGSLPMEVTPRRPMNLGSEFNPPEGACVGSRLQLEAFQSRIQIYYKRRSVRLRCRRWRCRIKVSWKHKTVSDKRLTKGIKKTINLGRHC